MWLVRAQHAHKLGMTIPELEWWLNDGGGSDYYRKLCAAWALEAKLGAERAQQPPQPPPRPGWRGGRSDVAETTIFEDEGQAA